MITGEIGGKADRVRDASRGLLFVKTPAEVRTENKTVTAGRPDAVGV